MFSGGLTKTQKGKKEEFQMNTYVKNKSKALVVVAFFIAFGLTGTISFMVKTTLAKAAPKENVLQGVYVLAGENVVAYEYENQDGKKQLVPTSINACYINNYLCERILLVNPVIEG